jgi:membrane protein
MIVTLLTTLRDFACAAWHFFATVLRRFWAHKILIMSAALAYYGFLAVLPGLLLGLSVGKHVSDSSDAFYGHAAAVLRGILPAQPMNELDSVAREFLSPEKGKLITGIGLVGLVWIGMRIFDVIEIELNIIWGSARARGYILRKGMAFVTFALASVLFVLSVVATHLTTAARHHADPVFGISLSELPVPWHVLTAATPVVLSIIMFLCLYTVLPNTTVSRRYALLGAVLAALVWELTKAVFQQCASYFGTYDRLYGSLAGVTIGVLWLNLSAFSLLLGAEVASLCQEHEAQSSRPGTDGDAVESPFASADEPPSGA